MNEDRKLTLRNHAELMAGELDDAMLKVASIIDDIYAGLQDLLDKLKEVNDVAWELENLCREREMGKRRFE